MHSIARQGPAPLFLFPLFMALVLATGFFSSGCSGTFGSVRHNPELDSLNVINRRLASEVRILSDSLALLDGIDSGQYYRDFRALQNRNSELDYKLAVCLDGGRVVAAELVDELFAPASATLTDTGKKRLAELLDGMMETLMDRELRVHGHSDTSKPSAGMAKTWPTNWELSAARASAVTRFLIEKYGIAPDRIAAVGFGDARPIESQKTPEARKQNRRIEIVAI
jgi:chemotaxis protein MotB